MSIVLSPSVSSYMSIFTQLRRIKPGLGKTRPIPANPQAPLITLESARVRCHLDYLRLRGILSWGQFRAMLNYVSSVYEIEGGKVERKPAYQLDWERGWSAGQGAVRFNHTMIGDKAIRGGYSIGLLDEYGEFRAIDYDEDSGVDDDMFVSWMLDFPGEFWESKTVYFGWLTCVGLKKDYKAICTRIDIAIDDFDHNVIPINSMVHSTTVDHNNFYFKRYRYISEYDTESRQYSDTHYFGSRESGKLVRVYKHKFDDKCTSLRYESEFKKSRARKLFEAFASIPWDKTSPIYDKELELQRLLGAWALGAIDFRNKNARKDRDKASAKDCPRLDFWQRFIDVIGGCEQVKVEPRIQTFERTMRWLRKTVAPSISAIFRGLPTTIRNEALTNILETGEGRGTGYHRLLNALARLQPDRVALALSGEVEFNLDEDYF